MQLLFIENDPRDIELTRSALGKAEFDATLVGVSDEVEALDYLCRRGRFADREPEDPAVIFLDLRLQDRLGTELIASIRALPGFRHVPIVMLTTSHDAADVEECYRRGANAYVAKSMDFSEFTRSFLRAVRFWSRVNVRPTR